MTKDRVAIGPCSSMKVPSVGSIKWQRGG